MGASVMSSENLSVGHVSSEHEGEESFSSIAQIPFNDLSIRIDERGLKAPVRITYDQSMMTEEFREKFRKKEYTYQIDRAPESYNKVFAELKSKIKAKVSKMIDECKRNGAPIPSFFNFDIESDRVPMRCSYSRSLGEEDGDSEEGYMNEVVIVRRGREETPQIDNLFIPAFIKDRLKRAVEKKGLVLVAGGTNTGKSTTLGAVHKYFLTKLGGRLIEIGDPIEMPLRKEFPSNHAYAAAIQKEVYSYQDLTDELKTVLRMSPNAVSVSEIRDGNVGSEVLNIANAGHFTTSTIHASSTKQTIVRLMQMCVAKMGENVWGMIADSLQMVLYQERCEDGKVRIQIFDMSLFGHQEKTIRSSIEKGNLNPWDGQWRETMDTAWKNYNEQHGIDGAVSEDERRLMRAQGSSSSETSSPSSHTPPKPSHQPMSASTQAGTVKRPSVSSAGPRTTSSGRIAPKTSAPPKKGGFLNGILGKGQ